MTYIHETAIIEEGAVIEQGCSIWHFAHIRKGARIGSNCIIAKGVFIDCDVIIGSNCKIQNNVSIYKGVVIEDNVFIGPHVCFTNDLFPRAATIDGAPLKPDQWTINNTIIKKGASIGANSTIICGNTVEEYALIGAGSVVAKSIPHNALAFGNPARLRGIVSSNGAVVSKQYIPGVYVCNISSEEIIIL